MHCVTSWLFLVSALEVASPKGRIMLLHGHFRTMIGYWISRGRPALHIEDVLMKHTASPAPPGGDRSKSVVADEKGAKPQPRNSWLTIAEHASVHPDEHLTKVRSSPHPCYTPLIVAQTIRSLMYAHAAFGISPAGTYKSSLPGTEIMDGSIFLRVRLCRTSSQPDLMVLQAAGMSLDTIGWVGQTGDWDRSVLGFDKAWEDAKKE